jgi:hypothetical protein
MMMIAAGAILLVDTRQYDIGNTNVFDERVICGWGWPVCLLRRYNTWGHETYSWDEVGVFYDIGLAVPCLFTFTFLTEYLLRRHESARPEQHGNCCSN